MLFCEGILLEPFETGAHSREPSGSLHTGERVCYEAAAPKKDFQRHGNILDLTSIISLHFPISLSYMHARTHTHTHTLAAAGCLVQPVFIASVWLQCVDW